MEQVVSILSSMKCTERMVGLGISRGEETIAKHKPRKGTQSAKPNLKAVHTDDDNHLQEAETPKLSKAQRRRLRKEERQQRRAA